MHELVEQYGGAIVAAMAAMILFAILGSPLTDALYAAGDTYNSAGFEVDRDAGLAAVENVISNEPPDTSVGTVRAGKDYIPDDIVCHTDGHVTVIDMDGEGEIGTHDGVQYIRFFKKGIYRIRYTVVGAAGGEKTRNIYLNVTN